MIEAGSDKGLEATLAAARRAAPQWNAGRQQQIKWATAGRLERAGDGHRRKRLMIGASAVAVAALVAGAVVRGRGGATPERAWSLADGTSIVLDGPTAVLKKTVETSDEVGFQLEAGGAHFEVARRPSRTFRVHAGPVTVQVIGTRFHVQRRGNGAHVGVDRGRVLVSWWGGARELGPGDAGTFPPLGPPSGTPAVAEAAPAVPMAATPGAARTTTAGAGSGVRAELLFSRADRARADGQPEAALAPLREIISRYPRDPHAPAAAFTVGRLLLEALGRPREAALAFAQARALAKDGPLGEDALAREVEALHVAGDSAGARQRAELYSQLFPAGSRLSSVMRFGGSKAVP
jgi:transmembrane sensor